MPVVPSQSAVRTTIRARQTCFCGLLRLRMIVSSRTRSSAVTVMEIPLRITNNRTKPNLQKLLFGLFRQVQSTRMAFKGKKRSLSLQGDQQFESPLLQRRVRCEPDFLDGGAEDFVGFQLRNSWYANP